MKIKLFVLLMILFAFAASAFYYARDSSAQSKPQTSLTPTPKPSPIKEKDNEVIKVNTEIVTLTATVDEIFLVRFSADAEIVQDVTDDKNRIWRTNQKKGGGFRQIVAEVKDKSVKVRTKRGYYAQNKI